MEPPVLVGAEERSALEAVAEGEHDPEMEAVVNRSVPVVEEVERLAVVGQAVVVVVALVDEGDTEAAGVVAGRATCGVALSKGHHHQRAP